MSTNTNNIPCTQNQEWGFWGTMNEHAPAAWPLAMQAISDATYQPLESVRIFLDSRHGRHFADSVQSNVQSGDTLEQAIAVTTQQYMGWKIDYRTRREYGIPRDLPYLTGFVIHCEVTEASFA